MNLIKNQRDLSFSLKCYLRVLLPVAILFCLQDVYGQAEFRKYSNDYLSIGAGAKAHGMGRAVAASETSINASFWNPAGLHLGSTPMQLSAMHAEWFAGIVNYDFIGIAKTFNEDTESYGGISIIRSGVDNIPNTINLFDADGSINYDNISSFSVTNYAFLLTYGRRLGLSNWRFGANVKILHPRFGPFGKGWGFGIDGALKYQNDRLSFGFVLNDVTSTITSFTFTFTDQEKQILQETGNLIPNTSSELRAPNAIIAGGYKLMEREFSSLYGELNLALTFDGQANTLISSKLVNIDPRIGLEYGYKETVFVRAGLANFQNKKDDLDPEQENLIVDPHFGIGIALGQIHLDYALANIGSSGASSSFSHVFSLIFNFKPRA